MLIISVGQGGINPMKIFWEENKEILRRDTKKKTGGKGKAKVGGKTKKGECWRVYGGCKRGVLLVCWGCNWGREND